MLTNVFKFFTIWVLILTIFNKYTNSIFNLTFLSLVVLIAGFYLSFVHPKYYNFEIFGKTIKIDGFNRFILVDLILHLGVFLYNYNRFGLSTVSILPSILLILFYLISVDFHDLYKL